VEEQFKLQFPETDWYSQLSPTKLILKWSIMLHTFQILFYRSGSEKHIFWTLSCHATLSYMMIVLAFRFI